MAKKQYTSPMMEVNVLNDEDIITASVFTTEGEINGGTAQIVVGGFNQSWLG